MFKKYSLKKSLFGFKKVPFNGSTYLFGICDENYRDFETLVFTTQFAANLDAYGLVIPIDTFWNIIDNPNTTYWDLVKASENIRVMSEDMNYVEKFAKKANLPWTSFSNEGKEMFLVIEPNGCSLAKVQHPQPNNPFV